MSASDPPSLEELIRSQNPWLSHFLSSILGEARPARERIVIVNPIAHSMLLIEGSGNLEALFGDLHSKDGPLPASKASIEAMPVVAMAAEEEECAICLAEFGVGGEAKEMPCKHRYHSGCIDKWLGIHGSCPVCRYQMPVEAEENEKNRAGDEIWFSFYVAGSDRSDSDSGGTPDSNGSFSDFWRLVGDGSSTPTQDMEI